MQLVNSTTNKILTVFILFIILKNNSIAQSNSPYSRYGLGDLNTNINILNRGMGGASIGFGSDRFLNTSNPASYSWLGEPLSKIPDFGKLISFEVGTEFNGRSLKQQNPIGKYRANDLVFNYMQLGMQLSKNGNWGLTFGLMPLAREAYKIETRKRITNVDSAQTIFEGNGGANKVFVGTGYRFKNLSLGFNTGYIFGKKNTTTNLQLLSDSIIYYESSSLSKVNYGSFFLQTGFLYNHILINNAKKGRYLRFGGTYELQNSLRANQDIERLVYENSNTNNPGSAVDSIFVQKDVKGRIILPSTYGLGISYVNEEKETGKSVILALDYVATGWNNYRFYGQPDQVQNNWTVKSGIQWTPARYGKNYWGKVSYRTGFNIGRDYIKAGGDLPVYAFTLGFGLPVPSGNKRTGDAITTPAINIALEAGKRGNNQNNLTENFVRIALSVSLADVWFFRRKYE